MEDFDNYLYMLCIFGTQYHISLMMLHNAGLSPKYWTAVVLVVVSLKILTLIHSVIGESWNKAWQQSRIKPWWKDHCVFGCLALVQDPEVTTQKLDYRAISGIFVRCSILTKQYRMYNPLAKMLHCARDVVFSIVERYTSLNAAVKAILNEHCYCDVI